MINRDCRLFCVVKTLLYFDVVHFSSADWYFSIISGPTVALSFIFAFFLRFAKFFIFEENEELFSSDEQFAEKLRSPENKMLDSKRASDDGA